VQAFAVGHAPTVEGQHHVRELLGSHAQLDGVRRVLRRHETDRGVEAVALGLEEIPHLQRIAQQEARRAARHRGARERSAARQVGEQTREQQGQ